MNKQEYVLRLEKALKNNRVEGVGEIIDEYSRHFDMKTQEGRTEEETAARLAPPEAIAGQYGEDAVRCARAPKILIAVGLAFADIFCAMLYVLVWGIVIVAAAGALAFFALGFCLISTLNPFGILPYVPYLPAFVMGVSALALGMIFTLAAIYCFLLAVQIFRAYASWHRRVMSGRGAPNVSIYPQMSKRGMFVFKKALTVSLLIAGALLIAGYLIMVISAGNFEPWHVWGWFVK